MGDFTGLNSLSLKFLISAEINFFSYNIVMSLVLRTKNKRTFAVELSLLSKESAICIVTCLMTINSYILWFSRRCTSCWNSLFAKFQIFCSIFTLYSIFTHFQMAKIRGNLDWWLFSSSPPHVREDFFQQKKN